ncbi:lysophospholipid acyltransferase family protein [Dyadobacter diqingensis]|uniref:lysophospholipid acyltransferase family protein n=1 Tax=Dyadobacter diqingensis TaxID=2938121 RepID=UPI0020C1A1BF|nr:lysophospholipid acyltransferase family protein [Dyadobacter diqingensis]
MLLIAVYELISDVLFVLLSHIFKYRSKVIRKNLKSAFPWISQNEQADLTLSYYRHMADLIVEPFIISGIHENDIRSFARYENSHLLNNILKSGKDVLLMMSHYGNWEYLLTLPLITDYEVVAVYSPISNPVIDKQMKSLRSRFGVTLVAKSDWYRTVLKRKSARPTVYIMISDQRPVQPYKHDVHFLGLKTYVQAGCEKIAQKLKCAVVYVDVEKTERHCYKYRLKLLSEDGSLEAQDRILNRFYDELEKTILRKPELYLWSHDRWKNH